MREVTENPVRVLEAHTRLGQELSANPAKESSSLAPLSEEPLFNADAEVEEVAILPHYVHEDIPREGGGEYGVQVAKHYRVKLCGPTGYSHVILA